MFREENYANPEEVTSLQLVIYKAKYPDKAVQKSKFQLEAEMERRGAGSSSHVSLLSKPVSPKEVALVLNLQFNSYSEMITLALLIESQVDQMQKRKYAMKRAEDDFKFWNNCKMYAHMLTRQAEFWKFNSITEEQFLANVDTGDILLFRSESERLFGQWITRSYTNSHFDHVALVLRFGEKVKDLYLFEAVGLQGVRLISWLNLRGEMYAGGFFDKVITRKLIYEMTTQRLSDLDEFRRKSNGNSYGLHPSQLLFTIKS